MTVPSYETDLQTFDLAENTGAWLEFTGMIAGGAPDEADTDNPIQGSYLTSQTANTTGLISMGKDYGSGVSVPTDGAFLIWHQITSPGLLELFANGGMRAVVGSGAADWSAWKTGGRDVPPNPYGGWQNIAIDPTLNPDYTYGSPSAGVYRVVGVAAQLTAGIAKGQPHQCDAIRYGRCEARFRYGETGNYATLAGFAAVNDAVSARWGLIQAVMGGFLWKGLMTLGYTNAVDFRDANTVVMIQDTRKVGANFNKIEIRQSGSRVDWTNISFLCVSPSTTASKGRLEVVDDCDVNISGCVFTDMDTFIFKASSDVLNCVFRRCNTITANDAKFAGTLFDQATVAADASQLIWNVATDPISDLAGCEFVKGGNAHHAIEFGLNSPTSMTLTNMVFTGFNASNGQNDSALHIKRTSGTVTITLSGTSQPSYKSDGATVEFVTGARTVKVIAQTATGAKINEANVFLATGEVGNLPYKASVTISNSGNVATVTHASHGMVTNDKVWIEGASHDANNGVFTITKINDNQYSYTMGSAPGSDPTGTITATFVYLKGLTDASGEISMSRSIPGTQLANGWARKSSGIPHYKTGAINGDVISTGDTTFSAVLTLDD